jgi:hypothetical protein
MKVCEQINKYWIKKEETDITKWGSVLQQLNIRSSKGTIMDLSDTVHCLDEWYTHFKDDFQRFFHYKNFRLNLKYTNSSLIYLLLVYLTMFSIA